MRRAGPAKKPGGTTGGVIPFCLCSKPFGVCADARREAMFMRMRDAVAENSN
jgi:hypothetical protein